MNGFAYVELYVRDEPAARRYFSQAFDFRVVAEAHLPDQRSVLLRGGGIQLVLTTPVAPHSPADYWLAHHGDGIADIAIYCDDVPAVLARGAEAGLPVLRHPRVGGSERMSGVIGGLRTLRHTLIDPEESTGPVAPPGLPWVSLGSPVEGQSHPSRLELLDHVAVCLPAGSLQQIAALYEHVFGLAEHSREQIRVGESGMDSRVLRDPSGAITYVMAQPSTDSRGGQVEEFVRRHGGAGVQHLAFATAGIIDAVRAYVARGVEFCQPPPTYFDRLMQRLAGRRPMEEHIEDLRKTGVLVASDHAGLLWQIFTRSPHRGRVPGQEAPFFYELIQRDGARDFASDNVVELFRAREAAAITESGVA